MTTDSVLDCAFEEPQQLSSGESSLVKSSIQDDDFEKPALDIIYGEGETETVGTSEIRVANAVITGWQLYLVLLCLLFALLLSTLETTIVATTLVSIASSFGQFDISGWIVVAYLLTYTGFLIVFARLSDFFGRKNALLVALAFFTVFSGVCGAAQTMEQLIVFRAFQGIGGSGIYSMVMVVIPEIVPLPKLGLATGGIGAMYAASSILGPTLGGLIVSRTTWRWVFLLNVPCGVVIIALVFWIYPSRPGDAKYFERAISQVDWIGFILLIAGSVMLVFALQEGGLKYPWDSGTIIASFVVAGICWTAFGIWEGFLSRGIFGNSMVAVFPLQLAKNRIVAASLASVFLVGFPYMTTIISLPQRFQIVNNETPISAGLHCLPLLLSAAVSSAAAGAAMTKKNISFWVLLASNVCQVLGTGLLSSIPYSEAVLARTYVFEVIMGIGIGFSLVSLLLIARVELRASEQGIIIGAINQLRILGAVIGLGISATALSNYVKPRLASVLSPEQLSELFESSGSVAQFPPEQAATTRAVYNDAYNLQMRIVMGFALASLVISLLAFRRHPLDLNAAGLGEGERVETLEYK